MRTLGTSASKAVKLFLLSLMKPGQDFFMSLIILQTPGMKNLDCMWLRVWRTSRPCPILECASHTIHLARMVFLQIRGTQIRDTKLRSEKWYNSSRDWMMRCLSLLVVMTVSAAVAKHLMTKERMEALTELQVTTGLGFCLRVPQLLCMKVRAVITLERL